MTEFKNEATAVSNKNKKYKISAMIFDGEGRKIEEKQLGEGEIIDSGAENCISIPLELDNKADTMFRNDDAQSR